MKRKSWYRLLVGLGVLAMFSTKADAQYLRSSYFMNGVEYRMQLNPALAPSRGYIHLPLIGGFNANISSNSLSVKDVQDILKHSSEDSYFTSDAFLNKLKNNNNINVSLNATLLGAGWYSGNNFWSFGVNLRSDVQADVPKKQFVFMKDVEKINDVLSNSSDASPIHASFSNEKFDINLFSETYVGWSRSFGRLSVGAKVKALLGHGRTAINVNKASVAVVPKVNGSINIDADIEGYFKGVEMETENDNKVTGVKFNEKELGLAGMGFGMDLGASYQITDHLTVAASVVDLGMISWKKDAYQEAKSKGNKEFDLTLSKNEKEMIERLRNPEVMDYDMLALKKVSDEKSKGKTTKLSPTVTLGAEYGFLNDKLSVGALYTGRFTPMKNINELTLSGNYKPNRNINLTVSYSMLQSGGKGLGLAAKLGFFFVGTDYMFFGDSTQTVNAMFGINIPLGKKKDW